MPQITDAEWEVMKALWAAGPLTAGGVVRELEGRRATDWRPRTIKTLLARLVRKGAVATERVEGASPPAFLYRARVTREACARREGRSFLHRVYDGALAPALLHFLEGADLSPDDVRRLRRLLEEAGRSSNKEGGP